MIWLLSSMLAWSQNAGPPPAEDMDVDPSLAWPAMGCASVGQVEGVTERERDVCGGARITGASRPVVEGGAAHVGARLHAAPGLMIVLKRFQVGLAVPLVVHWANEHGSAAAQGLGDPMISGRWRARSQGAVRLDVLLDLRLPVGTRESWIAERGVRVRPGAVLEVGRGPHQAILQTGVVLRSTPLDPPLSSAPWFTGALAWRGQWSDLFGTQLALVGRLVPETINGVEQGPLELRATGVFNVGGAQLEVGLGTALVRGVGSTRLRVGLGVWSHRQEPRQADEEALELWVAGELPPICGPDDACPSEPVGYRPDEGSELVDTEDPADPASSDPQEQDAEEADEEEEPDPQVTVPSVVLDTLYFELGTDRLLPESEPVLRELITDLIEQPKVGPILLEGHASQEGSFGSNYALSLARADAIYRRLVDAGVSPARLVLRPLGEVDDDAIESLPARRRVEVRLVLDPLFADDDVVLHPFTGQEIHR